MKVDLNNLGDRKFLVVQKVHTVAAFKEMDKTQEFQKLTGHESRMVLAYVIDTNSPAMVVFSNMRSNDITNQFGRQMCPQNFLHVFDTLVKKDRKVDNMKVIERMCKHSRTGPNEITSVLKLCKWSPDRFRCLIDALEVFEVYETRDVSRSGRYGTLLARGEKLSMTNTLFNQLGKCEEKYFLKHSEKVVSGEISLKNLIDENILIIEVRKVASVLSQITGYQSVEKLSRRYPGKFDFEALTAYVGAEVKDGKLNQKAIELERHYQNVKTFSLKSISSPVNFVEISSCDEMSESGSLHVHHQVCPEYS